MESKNLKNPFNDDFASIFNDTDMEIDDVEDSQQAMSELVKLLEDETSPQKKLETIQHLTTKFLSKISFFKLEDELLRPLISAIRTILDDVFKEIHQNLSFVDTGVQKSKDMLNILQDYLQMCIAVHEALDYVLEYIMRNKDFDFFAMRSLPLNVADILLLTFQHCKESDKIYKIYFDDLKEILALFKTSQDVHIKFLKILELTRCELQSGEQIELLKSVLTVIGRIGEVLIDMNIKAWADTWKGYMATTQKFSKTLNSSSFDISQSIKFLSAEIARNVKTVLEMKFGEHKGAIQTLKICNFSIRVICKLCDTFWPTLQAAYASVASFFITIYNFYVPLLRFKGCDEVIVHHMQSLIFDCSDVLLKKLIEESHFLQSFSRLKAKEDIGYLFFITIIFQKIARADRQAKLDGVRILIELYFHLFGTCYSELFWKVQVVNDNDTDITYLYDVSVTNIAVIILLLGEKEYGDIQKILLENVLQDRIWNALLATDVWCLVLKKKPSRFGFETLCHILNCTESLLLHTFSSRPEAVFLQNFLRRLCANVPEEHKILLTNKFPLATKLHIWKALGIANFPKSQLFMLESLINNMIEKIDKFQLGKSNSTDFEQMCITFEIVSCLSEEQINKFNLKQLLDGVMKLWHFSIDGSSCGNDLLKHFISKLCLVTSNLMVYIENEQLLTMLWNLKQMLTAGYDLKLQTSRMLIRLSNKIIPHTPEQPQILELLVDIINIIFQDKNPIIEWYLVEVCSNFLKVVPHKTVLHSFLKSEAEFQYTVSNFKFQKAGAVEVDMDDYFARQGSFQFQHRCPNLQLKSARSFNNGHGQRRAALCDEVDSIVKRIKCDVELLHTMCGKEDVLARNVSEIVDILKRQINY